MEMFCIFIVGAVTWLHAFTKIHGIIHLKWVNITVYNLETHKPDFNKSQLIGKGKRKQRGPSDNKCYNLSSNNAPWS